MARKKELERDLKNWLGKDWKSLAIGEQEEILRVYDSLTKSELRPPTDTIRRIYERESAYGLLMIGSIYGISLSLLAGAIDKSLERFGILYLFGTVILFAGTSFFLVRTFMSISRGDAKHWKLLKALQDEAKKSKAVGDSEAFT